TVLQRANGEYAEYGLLASFTALAPTWTAATVALFYKGDHLIEMDLTLDVFNDIGTAAFTLDNPNGLFCGPPNSPILAIGSAGVWFEQMYGFYVPNNHIDGTAVGGFQGATDDDTGIALPGKEGYRIIVTGIGMDADGADDDLIIYTWNGLNTGKTYYDADEAAGQTALSLGPDPGWADTSNVWVISERADGSYAELSFMSGYTTAGVATVGALVNSFKDGDLFFETESYKEWDDWVDAAYTLSNRHALVVGPANYGLAFMLDDTSGIMDYVIGFYESVAKPRRTVAHYIPDDTATGATGAEAALPNFQSKQTCVDSISYDPTTASGNSLRFYVAVQPFDSAKLTGNKAAGATTLAWASMQGADNFSDTAVVVLVHPNGNYAELGVLSAASLTAATIGALDNAFPKGTIVYEMVTNDAHYTLTGPVADAETVIENNKGIFCGPIGSPVGASLSGTNSQIHYLTGFVQ
ncbi:hypothetical protein KAR91_06260, partial [Candidatus Pacearchaeota archaeon]|nr:hypothetical protein [Candidatus Pacearchaeota archaeon]